MYIQDLVVEVTRRCNMLCEHCLRGNAQNKNITHEIIDRLLESVTYIGTVTFTGGEPSLNVSAIKYFIKKVEDRRISIGGFYVVTNGKIQSIALVKALIDLYSICEEKEVCGLVVSRDQYHDGCRTPLYEALTFYQAESRDQQIPQSAIINEGRANYNGIGARDIEVRAFELDDDQDDDEIRVNSLVYISANGNVMSDCDCSYRRIDEESKGNLLTESLDTIVTKGVVHELEAA